MNKHEVIRQAEDKKEYIEIPLDTHKYTKNLTTRQVGAVFKNICSYFFGDVDFEDLENNVVKNATENMIARIEEYAKNGE